MRRWVKFTLATAAVFVVGFLVLAGTTAYFALRHLDRRVATEVDGRREFDAIKARFGARAPLIEVVGARQSDIRIQRAVHPEGRRSRTVHMLTWNAEDAELFRTEVPVWLMQFNLLNVLSKLGIAPESFRLTVEDLERYGPGIVIDYNQPGNKRVLVWLD